MAIPEASSLEGLASVLFSWSHIKTFAEHSIGFSNDALHVLAGFLLQVLVAAILRTSLQSPWPWLVVFMLEIVNEASDLVTEIWPDLAAQLGEGAKDMLLTMIIPTLVLLLTRYAGGLFCPVSSTKTPDARQP